MSGTIGAKGRDAALQISTNGGSTYVTVPGVRTTGLTINNNPVDITNAGSPSAWQEMLADGGIQALDVSVDGVMSSGAAFAAFFAHAQNRTVGFYRIAFGNGGGVDFRAVIGSFGETGTYNDAQTFTAQMMSSGVPSFTAPT